MKNLGTVLTEEEVESILIPIAEKAQSIIDDCGAVTVKVYSDSFTFEFDFCTSIQCDGIDIEILFQDYGNISIPVDSYISGDDLNSLNPVLQFKDIFLELDMLDEEDC